MKTKKVLLGSLVLAGVVSACTNEDVVNGVQNNTPLTGRTQVNLTLSAPEVDSRMSAGAGWASNMEGHDILGAVLVDNGYTANTAGSREWNNVDWTVISGHVGNNKWAYNKEEDKFKTEGTTSVGSWLFYTKYNEKMTTTRNGVEFSFPQIQEGSTNLAWVMNNNANFMISPVTHIDGYEGQNLDFEVKIASVFNYLRMPFDMSATQAERIQKIIVKAKDENGTAKVFPTKYVVDNTKLPEACLSLDAPAGKDVKCPNVAPLNVYDVTDQNEEMERAYDQMVYQTKNYTSGTPAVTNWSQMASDMIAKPYIKAVNGHVGENHLVVDLDGEHTDKAGNGGLAIVDGRFSAVMLMPAGVYSSITFDIYTDKGVYTKEVTDNSFYRFNLPVAEQAAKAPTYGKIILRPGRVAVLSDIQGEVEGSNYAETLTANEYIKVTDLCTEPQYITKTADLINFINGIKVADDYDVNVMAQAAIGGGANDDEIIPEHGVIVNQAVMTAIETKEAALNADIQINLVGATVKVKGNDAAASALNIHDLTFSNGADLVSGYVKATNEVMLPTSAKMTVKSGVNVELALVNPSGDKFYQLIVEDGASAFVSTNSRINYIDNQGSFKVNEGKTLTGTRLRNQSITATTRGGNVEIAGVFVAPFLTNDKYATLTNDGEITNTNTSSNAGTITNNGDMNVQAAFTNNGNITIAANAKVHVNSTGTASVENNGTITNNGMLYTKVGYNNTITNLGTIDAKSGSTTYITKNSKTDETSVATNNADQVMGTLKIAERNLDVTVTTPANQGYIEYTAVASDIVDGEFDTVETVGSTKDKFNKVIFSSAATLTTNAAGRVKYIVTNKDLSLPTSAFIQEVTFTGNASLYAYQAKIASLTVNENVLVKVPTENIIGVDSYTLALVSSTTAEIHNAGEILVGGDFYTTIVDKASTTGGGEFSAGDGNATAFHWNTMW